jgi:phenylpropionate dioxygenase-like ring-hydroxylating dioxygenase large terminal subunit
MLLDVGVTPCGRPRGEGITTWGLDILTPETEVSTHYFWGTTRDFALESSAVDDMMIQVVDTAFTRQDKPMLEAVQRNMGGRSFDELHPLLLPIDSGAVRARRLLADIRTGKRRPEQPAAAANSAEVR